MRLNVDLTDLARLERSLEGMRLSLRKRVLNNTARDTTRAGTSVLRKRLQATGHKAGYLRKHVRGHRLKQAVGEGRITGDDWHSDVSAFGRMSGRRLKKGESFRSLKDRPRSKSGKRIWQQKRDSAGRFTSEMLVDRAALGKLRIKHRTWRKVNEKSGAWISAAGYPRTIDRSTGKPRLVFGMNIAKEVRQGTMRAGLERYLQRRLKRDLERHVDLALKGRPPYAPRAK